MNKTKIEWVKNPDGSQGFTWNPVTGCRHDCSYCYARRISDRFKPTRKESILLFDNGHLKNYKDDRKLWQADRLAGAFPASFLPTFYPHRLEEPLTRKKPATIFVCSMADLFGEWVPAEWIEAVLKTVRACPQHTFLFLTKNPKRYREFNFSKNCMLGATATDQESWDRAVGAFAAEENYIDSEGNYTRNDVHNFISAEPLLGPIDPGYTARDISWLIIGADSTRGAKKPERQWVMDLYNAARLAGVPVFMKDNLKPLLSALDLRREFPEVMLDV